MAEALEIINHWEAIVTEFSKNYELKHGIKLDDEDIIKALYLFVSDNDEIEWIGDVLEQMYSLEEVEEILKDFDFKTLQTFVETSLELIPNELRFNTKVRVKSKGVIWVIHKYDNDPFPSNPHGHDLNSNIKLHLGNGMCYIKKEFKYKINSKELLKIRQGIVEKCSLELPPLEV